MAIIRKIGARKMQPLFPPKIPVKEKWEKLAASAAKELNGKTSHWKRRQQKYFLTAFSLCFLSLLAFSFLFTVHPVPSEHPVHPPDVSRILPEKQISKVLPSGPGKEPPPPAGPDSTSKKSIHSH